jgi:hypothetical protein
VPEGEVDDAGDAGQDLAHLPGIGVVRRPAHQPSLLLAHLVYQGSQRGAHVAQQGIFELTAVLALQGDFTVMDDDTVHRQTLLCKEVFSYYAAFSVFRSNGNTCHHHNLPSIGNETVHTQRPQPQQPQRQPAQPTPQMAVVFEKAAFKVKKG